tara:strand:- start:84 stop:4082 length:3999 start_codon:yes stop_codon:yes gene_type:complete
MTKDFRASQVETSKLIASGGIAGTTVGIAVYSGSIASDRAGAVSDSTIFNDVGTDVFLFVSGSKNLSTFNREGVTLFGGDIVVSGTLYAERQVIEVDGQVDGDMIITGSLFVEPDANSTKSISFRKADGTDIFVVDSTNSQVEVTGRVGINDSNPGGILDIVGASDSGVPTVIVVHGEDTRNALQINADSMTTANGLFMSVDALTTGAGIKVWSTSNNLNGSKHLDLYTNSTSTDDYTLAAIRKTSSNLSDSNPIIGLDIDFDGTAGTAGRALRIDSEQTTGVVAEIDGSATTTGKVISVAASALTTGNALHVDHNDAATTAVTPTSIHLDFDRSGNAGDGITQEFKGLHVDMADTATSNHANSSVIMTGIDVAVDSANTQGSNHNIGLSVTVTDATTNDGINITTEDGAGSDIKIQSSANPLDYAEITVTGNGVTNFKTVDADNSLANLTFEVDGATDIQSTNNVTIDSSAGTIGIGTDAVDNAINVGTGGNRSVTIGKSGGTSTVSIYSQGGTLELDATNQEVNIDSAAFDVNASGAITIDTTDTTSGVTIATATSGVPVSIGHTTSKTSINDDLHVTGNTIVTGSVGLGIDPTYKLDIVPSTSSAFRVKGSTNGVDVNCSIENAGTNAADDALLAIATAGGAGDAVIRFAISGNETYSMGIDNSDGDKFKISQASTLHTDTRITIAGGNVGVGMDSPKNKFDLNGDQGLTGSIRFKEQSAPVAGQNEAVLYAKDVSGVTKLFTRQSDGLEIGPLGAGGSLDDGYDTPIGGGTKGPGLGAIITVDNQPVQLKVAGASKTALAITGSVIIGSGSDGKLPAMPGLDTNFFVSGTMGSKDTAIEGTSVFGGDAFVSGSLGINTVTITTDGKVGIGMTNPNYKLSVGGNAEFGEYLYHRGDVDTFIQFADDAIGITAGGEQLITITEAGQDIVKIGDGGDVDFQVRTLNDDNTLYIEGATDRVGVGTNSPVSILHVKELAPTLSIQRENNSNDSTIAFLGAAGFTGAIMHLSSSNDLVFKTHDGTSPHEILRLGSHYAEDVRQVIMLSGSALHVGAMQPKEAKDINFFVSGAMMSKGTSTRGTGVFGGDLVVSGGIYTGRVASIEDNTSFIDFAQNTIDVGANHTVKIQIKDGETSPGDDVNFFVSGSIDSRGNSSERGTSVFGGDVVISGSLRTKKSLFKHHLIWAGTVSGVTPRFAASLNGGGGANANPDTEHFWSVAGSGSLKAMDIWVSEASNSRVGIGLFVNSDTVPTLHCTGSFANNNIIGDGNRGHLFVDFGLTQFMSGSNNFNPGDLISITLCEIGGGAFSKIRGTLYYEMDETNLHSNQTGGTLG